MHWNERSLAMHERTESRRFPHHLRIVPAAPSVAASASVASSVAVDIVSVPPRSLPNYSPVPNVGSRRSDYSYDCTQRHWKTVG